MTFTVTSIMGGLGRIVIGSDGKPALVGQLGPIVVRTSVGDGLGVAYYPSPTITNQTAEDPPRRRRPDLGFVQSRNLNLLP